MQLVGYVKMSMYVINTVPTCHEHTALQHKHMQLHSFSTSLKLCNCDFLCHAPSARHVWPFKCERLQRLFVPDTSHGT